MKRKGHPSEDFDTHHQPDLKRVRLDDEPNGGVHSQHHHTDQDAHGLHHQVDESVYQHFHANSYANSNPQYAMGYDYGNAFVATGDPNVSYQHDQQQQQYTAAVGASGVPHDENHENEVYHGLYSRANPQDSFTLSNLHSDADTSKRGMTEEQEWMQAHQQHQQHDQLSQQQSQLIATQQFQQQPGVAQQGVALPDATGFDPSFGQVASGYQYLAYMSNNGKYEPVLIFYDHDGQARIQPAPELHEHLQEAMQYQMPEETAYEVPDPAPSSKKKSSSSIDDNQEKASVAELAKRIGLLKNEHKEWRFRDQKRTLLLKLSTAHQHYIENSSLDEILLRRLPHKITPTEFAKRIWLLVFHTVVAEGNTPKFWDRVSDREYLENQLDEEFKSLRNPQFATEVYNSIMRHDCSVQEAINSVAFQLSQQDLTEQQALPQQMVGMYTNGGAPQRQEDGSDLAQPQLLPNTTTTTSIQQ
uniref:Uncharacterized protein n=1 Tax=Percolomonas cosmopolitus TaxID=63605 RepID=A0A7S1KTG8_9EUKA|mmetsp:Transcript_89/g.326  ORF Transcript_89/g.326 Transcript_89/m.326 type:complete len:472 (+) Transcript_89:523-1938(+)